MVNIAVAVIKNCKIAKINGIKTMIGIEKIAFTVSLKRSTTKLIFLKSVIVTITTMIDKIVKTIATPKIPSRADSVLSKFV